MKSATNIKSGFTLVELSIVLVIIGLIVGGVLVGQDLIRAAAVRAQISQIEKFNTAINTFYGKYGALPGDMNSQTAQTFGFSARPGGPGQGDGNGIIEGYNSGVDQGFGAVVQVVGETGMFWVDLSSANGLHINMINGSFSSASWSTPPSFDVAGSLLSLFLPEGRIGHGNYVYVWSGGGLLNPNTPIGSNGKNYFGLSAVSQIATASDLGEIYSNPGLTVSEANSIDKKIDDGLPQTGRVTAMFMDEASVDVSQAAAVWAGTTTPAGDPYNTATSGNSSTCFDNGGGNGIQRYSVEINSGAGVNCALSFQFQ